MKILICGKGGSGKSTVTTLLARALNGNGKTVLVVDAERIRDTMQSRLRAKNVVAAIPNSPSVFEQGLTGDALNVNIPEVHRIRRFIDTVKRPVTLNVL